MMDDYLVQLMRVYIHGMIGYDTTWFKIIYNKPHSLEHTANCIAHDYMY